MSQERTEKPTPKRREEARKKGQIARRPELAAAVAFLASLVTLRALADSLTARAAHVFTGVVEYVRGDAPLTPLAVHRLMIEAVTNVALLALPAVAAALAAGLAGNFAQGGLTLTPGALAVRANKFNPAENVKRIFSPTSAVEMLKSLLVIGGIVLTCFEPVKQAITETPALVGAPTPEVFRAAGALVYSLGWRAGAVALFAAALDYGYGWFRHEKSLKMTRQEIRDEYRRQEGDPFVKGQRRRAARALLHKHLAAVKQADLIVTNPTHFAVALRYDREREAAPVVVAKGADFIAARIREVAREHEVTIVENPPLARALYRAVDVGRVIPPEFFRAVAELLAYVYRRRETAAR
jgi:flagellar biosynthesis protein FlhB